LGLIAPAPGSDSFVIGLNLSLSSLPDIYRAGA